MSCIEKLAELRPTANGSTQAHVLRGDGFDHAGSVALRVHHGARRRCGWEHGFERSWHRGSDSWFGTRFGWAGGRSAPYLYKPETIERFQERLREAFLSRDRGTARAYLRNLVDHIVVGEDEIIIEARANVALAMMAEPRVSLPTEGTVLTTVVDWHARRDSNP